jgi:mercuric ion binding protein
MHKTVRGLVALGLLLSAGTVFAAALRTVTLAVENMTCGTCPIVVRKALERVSGVTATAIDFDKKTATVTFDPDKTTSAKLIEATTQAGFPSKLMKNP